MEWLQSIMPVVLVVLLGVVVYYVLPWLKARLGTEEFDRLWNLVCIAVQAAEQLFPAAKSGADKLKFVLKWLQDQGVAIDDGMTRPMIEAAVRELT